MTTAREMTPTEIAERDATNATSATNRLATTRAPATNAIDVATNTNTRGEIRERASRETKAPENAPKPSRPTKSPANSEATRSTNRRNKADFNAYQREYMRKRRARAKA